MKTFLSMLLGSAGLVCLASSAFAQVVPTVALSPPVAADEPSEGSEILVTALRRNERLQDVPVSITALSGDQLAEQRMD